MRPILYKLTASPPANAVMMLADMLAVQLDCREIDWVKLEHKSPDYMKMNPMGTIPVLKDEDFVVSERPFKAKTDPYEFITNSPSYVLLLTEYLSSSENEAIMTWSLQPDAWVTQILTINKLRHYENNNAIMKYLLEKYGGEKWEPLYPRDLRSRVAVDQGLFFNAGVFFVRLKVVALPTLMEGLPGATPKHLEDIDTAYGVVEAYLQDRPYIATNHLTLADLAVGSTAAYMQPIRKLDETR